MITGHLKPDSTLRAIFPSGTIPLLSPATQIARLGGATTAEDVYLLAVKQLTEEQRQAMARAMEGMGQGTYAEALAHLEKSHEFPIRSVHILSVGIPLRAFI